MNDIGKLATITARDFVEQGYAEKIKRGECVVKFFGNEVRNLTSWLDVPTRYHMWFADNGTPGFADDNDELAVTWLPAPAPTPTASSPAEGGADDELEAEILFLLGVDAGDWQGGLSGILAAIKSNLKIGSPEMSKVEDWTDQDAPNKGSITAKLFAQANEIARLRGLCDLAAELIDDLTPIGENPLLDDLKAAAKGEGQ